MNLNVTQEPLISQSELLRALNKPGSQAKRLTELGILPDLRAGRLHLYRRDRLAAIRETLSNPAVNL